MCILYIEVSFFKYFANGLTICPTINLLIGFPDSFYVIKSIIRVKCCFLKNYLFCIRIKMFYEYFRDFENNSGLMRCI